MKLKSVVFAIILFLLPGGMLFALAWGLWHKRHAVAKRASQCIDSPKGGSNGKVESVRKRKREAGPKLPE